MWNIRVIKLMILCVFTLYSGISHAGSTGTVDSSHDLSRGSSGAQFKYATDQVCVFCHTPHGANSSVRADSSFNALTNTSVDGTSSPILLWNRALSDAADYKLYDSSTSVTVTSVRVYSLLCLSCHDGVGALNVVQNYPADGIDEEFGAGLDWYNPVAPIGQRQVDQIGDVFDGGINIGERTTANGQDYVELRNDHPISVDYVAARAQDASGLVEPTPAGSGTYVGDPKIKLYGGYVECTSCHDPHNEGDESTGTKYPFLWVDNAGSNLCTTCHNK